jgi:hypothetical protein
MLEVEDDYGFRRGFDYRLEIAMFEGTGHQSIVATVTHPCQVGKRVNSRFPMINFQASRALQIEEIQA